MDQLFYSREDLTAAFTRAMLGEREGALGRSTGRVKTFGVEANLAEESPAGAFHRLRYWSERAGGRISVSEEDAIALVTTAQGSFVFDVLDPRFWLVHTLAEAEFVQQFIRDALWKSRDLDWCWLPRGVVENIRGLGRVQWFRTDFASDQLTPVEGERARRLRVQLDGDNAYELLQVIRGQENYRHAAPLTAMAIHVEAENIGRVREVADYKARFVATGDSFDLHVGVVSQIVAAYAGYVRSLERTHALRWRAESDSALSLSGEVVVIQLRKHIDDLETFAAGLFSCRDPFRLWAVPRFVSPTFLEAEAVDLHVGRKLRLEIWPEGIRVYLDEHGCGNSVARLVANLQHRYDATLDSN